MSDKFDCLKLENQLCFPLYAASREVLRRYTPLLKPLDLTYTQYIVLMVLWEQQEISVCELGKKLFMSMGSEKNLKLTSVEDIEIFKALLMSKDEGWLKR